MKVIKRNGTEVPFDYTKIKNAIEAANACVAEKDRLSDTMVGFIVGNVEKRCDALGRAVSVEEIQDMIVDELDQSEHYRLARHYSDYRLRHELLRKQSSTDAKVLSLLRHDNELAKQENANKDPVLNSTMREYLASEVSEDICRRYIFPEDLILAHDEGIVHVHDMGYVSGPITNCELVNLEDMLQNGTVITDTMIEKPHSFSTACKYALKNGTSWHCGCQAENVRKQAAEKYSKKFRAGGYEQKPVDIIGRRYGKLQVLSKIGDGVASKSSYVCKCDCGNKVVVKYQSLINPKGRRSCGCAEFTDLTGKRFGRLVARERVTAAEAGKMETGIGGDVNATVVKPHLSMAETFSMVPLTPAVVLKKDQRRI